MQLILLIGGLVLLLAGSSWFTGAVTVGWICLAVFVLITVFQILVIAGVAKAQSSIRRRF